MDKKHIEFRKLVSENLNEALKRKTKEQEKCLLCEEPKEYYVNSHSVPQFSLKSISDNGYIIGGGINTFIDGIESIIKGNVRSFFNVGISKAGVFKNICQCCENTFFRIIENEDDFLRCPWSKEQLIKSAIKSLLYEQNIVVTYLKIYQNQFAKNINDKLIVDEIINHQLKLRYQENELSLFKCYLKNKKPVRFEVVLDEVLNKKVNFATNSVIFPRYDGNLNEIIKTDIYGLFTLVLPKDDQTRIVIFYNKKYQHYNKIKQDVNNLDGNERYEYLSRLFILHTDRIYFNKIFLEENKSILYNSLFIKDYSFIKINEKQRGILLKKLKGVNFFK